MYTGKTKSSHGLSKELKAWPQTLERREPCGLLLSNKTTLSDPEGESQEPVSCGEVLLLRNSRGGHKRTNMRDPEPSFRSSRL